jgi:dolichyl-phosphate-mannose-protein mannosyltransferase
VPNKSILLKVLTPLFIGAYFLWLARDAFHSYFSPDACMTLYQSWEDSLLKANILFFLHVPPFRPMTCAWFRLIFTFAGFNPLAFHVASLAVLSANIWLTYCVTKRLTGSRETGALAALLISYHGRFMPLYFDTGHSYDVTCYFFYFLTFQFYIWIRSHGRVLRWRELGILSVLYVCALNCKEMATTLPVSLLLYEWLYHGLPLRSPGRLWKWATSYGRPVLITSLLTLAFMFGRATGGGLLSSPLFQPVFSWDRFMSTSRAFLTELFSQRSTVPTAVVLVTWIGLYFIAWATRSRTLKFAWLFIMLSVIPVAFIPTRGAGRYYISYFGWVLYAATALSDGSRWYLRKLPHLQHFANSRPVLLFLSVSAFMYWVNTRSSWSEVWNVSREGEQYRSIVQQLHQLRPTMRPGSRVLFLDDPLDDPWQMMFLVKLSYGDRAMEVDRVKLMQQRPSASEIASYDYVFDYVLGRFYSSPQPRKQGPQPVITLDYGEPQIFHRDWVRVTPRAPAQHGEVVITEVTDLGETKPPVPKDQPFPMSPYLDVVSPLEVRIDGRPAEIILKIGWPEKINRYRVDFRIPPDVRTGSAEVVVTAGNVTGPPMPIAVR